MDYGIIWTQAALEDLRELVRYIAADDPIAAERFGNAIIRRVEGIAGFPRVEVLLGALVKRGESSE